VSQAGRTPFDVTIEKTNKVLKDIEESYGWPRDRRQQSYDALRAVLHALRDRLVVTEAADMAAQLPMLIRGLFYEGWKPAKVPVKMSREEFLGRVRREFPFEVAGGPGLLLERVVQAIRRYVTEGEWQDIRSGLPRDLAEMLPA
jgi:uncharacterized protein (DUF2267 family)